MTQVIIEVDSNTRLRPAQLTDASSIFELVRANADHPKPWLPEVAQVNSASEVSDWIEPQIDAEVHEREIVFLIAIAGEIIGVINVHSLDYEASFG